MSDSVGVMVVDGLSDGVTESVGESVNVGHWQSEVLADSDPLTDSVGDCDSLIEVDTLGVGLRVSVALNDIVGENESVGDGDDPTDLQTNTASTHPLTCGTALHTRAHWHSSTWTR